MANHNYTIQFVSLRSATLYTLTIGGSSGTAIALNGAAQPFTTDEDNSEDVFIPVREQSGYIRVVDDGFGADGITPYDWKDMIPGTDSERPVTLTANGTVVWHGFMQSQNFSGELYNCIQEREFPVTGALSVLAGEDVDFNRGMKNFAFLLKEACDIIDVKSGGTRSSSDVVTANGMIHISSIMVQGGTDARQWLQTRIDWQNFAAEDGDGVLRSKYSLYEALEDMCRFWGWTARTCGTTLYLTCSDDAGEEDYLILTRAQLDTLAETSGDTSTGTVASPQTVTLADSSSVPIFASSNNEDYKIQGPHRAVVKGECNKQNTIAEFAPTDIENYMGDSYTWVQGDDDLVGYFTTPSKTANILGNETMKITTGTYGRIARRQIYQSTDSETPVVGDMMMCVTEDPGTTTPFIQLQTIRPMAFSGGSISFGGTVWQGAEALQQNENRYTIRARLGIGMSRATAKWFYIEEDFHGAITHGWDSTQERYFEIAMQGNNLNGIAVHRVIWIAALLSYFPSVPIEENTYGYIFIDLLCGLDYTNGNSFGNFEIANFSIDYKRDTYAIPSSAGEVRPREMKTARVTSKEYTAVNTNESKDEWNANCIFASDNNMEYGYGLLLDGSGNIISTVNYDGNPEHPEQHLANRVANYWATAKRMIVAELQSQVSQTVDSTTTIEIGEVTPLYKVAIDSGLFIPASISRVWRDDIVKIALIETS